MHLRRGSGGLSGAAPADATTAARLTDRDPGTDPTPASRVPLASRLPVTGYGRLGALIVTEAQQPVARHHDLYV